MKLYNKLIAVICSLCFILSFTACAPKGSAENFYYFNTVIHVETHSTVISATTKAELNALFLELENEFDVKIDGSITSRFNQMDKSSEIELTTDAKTILSVAKDCYAFSNGKFNPCIYPLTKLWGFAPFNYTPNYTAPTQQDIDSAKSQCDFNSLIIENSTLTKTQDYVKLDLGGIVKGYATDKALQILTDSGHCKGYVSVGSSSIALLSYPTLGITHPTKSGTIITCNTANANNLSVSTSGDYEKVYVDDNGTKYCHIIDPDSGYPTQTGVRSATILGVDGVYGDALTTAICLMEHGGTVNSQLIQFLNKITQEYPQVSFYVVYEKDDIKQLITNKTQNQDFTLHDTEFALLKI